MISLVPRSIYISPGKAEIGMANSSPKDSEIASAYWLSLRTIWIILDQGDTEEFRKYFREVLRPNIGTVNRKYGLPIKRGRNGHKMDMEDQAMDVMDILLNNFLPLVIPEEYVTEIRAMFADGLAAAGSVDGQYVSLRDI